MGEYNQDIQARTKQQNRSNVLQLKMIGSSHPTGLTNNLLRLFEARPPLEFKPPPEKRKCLPYTGMAQFVSNFAGKGDPEYQPPVVKGETPAQKKARIQKLKLEEGARKAAEELEKYDPHHNPDATGDPYKTLFVSSLNYETSESKIKREFEAYGPIKRGTNIVLQIVTPGMQFQETTLFWSNKGDYLLNWAFTNVAAVVDILYVEQLVNLGTYIISSTLPVTMVQPSWGAVQFKVRLVSDKSTSKPRGYAFIEYLHTRDMKAAYKQGDGRKIDGRRVLVDVERGRTVPNWRPRRLGGGLGTSRIAVEDTTKKLSERESRRASKSVEPKTRDDRSVDREREKSRERGREREREQEKSREHSHDRPRDRDHRDHKDRDRTRDRDRDSRRDRDRHGRDRDRPRERENWRKREYEVGEIDHERGRSRGKSYDRADSKHDRDRHRDRDDGHEYNEHDQGREQYGVTYGDQDCYAHDKYDQMEYNDHYDRATSEHLEKEGLQDMDYEY